MYKINQFVFQIILHHHISLPENMNKFKTEKETPVYFYHIYVVDEIDVKENQFIISKNDIKICSNDGMEKRYLYIIGDNHPYAVCEEINKNVSQIQVHKDYIHMMSYDTMFVSLLSLEKRMNEYHQYILHSAFIVIKNQAILFTAPSGTGKSTQASLWEKYRNARVINGDRSLIAKEDNIYYACGWPICGSSEICLNEKYPIQCLVVLSQGKENKIEGLSKVEATKKLLAEITTNYYNTEFLNNVLDFIDDLISHIQIYHLTCDISENAVKCLENQINKQAIMQKV